jgi:CDP-diacylglycerol--serine O-phosphatidyltransferase
MKPPLSTPAALVLVYGRPPLVFAGMLLALSVMIRPSPGVYTAGVMCLFISMSFDLVDGWFSARFRPQAKLAHLADRIMDKAVYSIVFPLVAVGMMWRYQHLPEGSNERLELLHVLLVLVLAITVLMRDNLAHFLRNFALRKGEEEEMKEVTRLRTVVAAPVGAILYAYAFYFPSFPEDSTYQWLESLGQMPTNQLIYLEVLFLIINFGSIAGYMRKYGNACLDDLCLGDVVLRRRILAIFPNALTVMNAMMGLLAVFFASQSRMHEAFLLLIGAAFFDKLDGALARKLGLTTPLPSAKPKKHHVTFGGILDDISDGVSFCIAPALMFYMLLDQISDPEVQALPYGWVALAYAALGIVRLIYFTLDRASIPGFFKGFPTPAAALLVAGPFIMLGQAAAEQSDLTLFWAQFCLWNMVLTAILMNLYPVRYLHVGRLMSRNKWVGRVTLLIVLTFVFTPYFGYAGFGYLMLYALSPLYTWRISPEVAAREESNARSSERLSA